MTCISEFRQGFLCGRSYQVDSDAAITREFDVIFLASSWDKRCLCLTSYEGISAKLAIGLFPDDVDHFGLREAHDRKLIDFLRKRSVEFRPITGNSRKVESVWLEIQQLVRELLGQQKRPLSILIDISACPRYYSIALMGTLLKHGLAKHVSLFYSEALYPEDDATQDFAFRGGRWKTVPIPPLLGDCEPSKNTFYLVSTGFEGSKTLRAISAAEPDRVSLLVPDPGFRPDYLDRNRSANARIIDDFHIPQSEIIAAPAGDLVAAWRALDQRSLERRSAENTYYLCCGTKPHSFALALRSLALGWPALLYVIPDEHRVVPTESSGVHWKFEIEDLSAFYA